MFDIDNRGYIVLPQSLADEIGLPQFGDKWVEPDNDNGQDVANIVDAILEAYNN